MTWSGWHLLLPPLKSFICFRSCYGGWAQIVSITGCDKLISGSRSVSRFSQMSDDSLSSLEQADAVLIVGSYPRHEAPLLNLRIRKAVLKGAKVIYIDTHGRPFNYSVSKEVIMKPSKLAPYLKELSESIVRLG